MCGDLDILIPISVFREEEKYLSKLQSSSGVCNFSVPCLELNIRLQLTEKMLIVWRLRLLGSFTANILDDLWAALQEYILILRFVAYITMLSIKKCRKIEAWIRNYWWCINSVVVWFLVQAMHLMSNFLCSAKSF